MARVSVVIPAYNASATLPATLESVLAQTYLDYEVIVVDDGSADDTADVAERFGGRVRCIRQPNSGVATARNNGVATSSGDLVAFLDADDLWRPRKLEVQVSALDKYPDAGVCYVGALRVDAELRTLAQIPARQYDDPVTGLLLHATIVSGSCSSGMVRRSLCRSVRFDDAFSQCADWNYWLHLGLRTKFLAVDKPLVMYRTTAGNMSSSIPLLERDTFAVLDAFFQLESARPYLRLRARAYSNHRMIVAGSYLHARQPLAAVRNVLEGLRADPFNLGPVAGLPGRWIGRLRRRGRRGPDAAAA